MRRQVANLQGISFDELAAKIKEHGLKSHSGSVEKGDVFIAVAGTKQDGAVYIKEALQRGAWAIVATGEQISRFFMENDAVSHCSLLDSASFCELEPNKAPHYFEDSKDALAALARMKFSTSSLGFPLVGITGTNGKTTITYLFEHLYKSVGKSAGVMGTVSYRWPGFCETAALTTPDCLKVHSMLARMRDEGGVLAAFVEVSSHALAQKRVLGALFEGALFTNLTQDHLDFHSDMEDYFAVKKKLFHPPYSAKGQVAVINIDDEYGRRLLEDLPEDSKVVTYSLKERSASRGVHLMGTVLSCDVSGLHLRMEFNDRTWEIETPLVGLYNALNLLAVQGMALELGFNENDFSCFKYFAGTPGRLERVQSSAGLHIFVDYAHTPDALVNVQRELKKIGFRRLVTVFGCGGNRDKGKRPFMGKAVAEYSDIAILTSDNPRFEDPLAIMNDIRPGLEGCSSVIEEPDRRVAIEKGISLLQEGDVLLIAGKGHEDYQIVGDKVLEFSDKKVVQEILACK